MRDLRNFIEGIEKLGELKTVRNADWDLEIGAITEISASEPNPPALLFDDIKDYPRGFRLLTNMFQTQSRTALALGLPTDLKGVDLVRSVKDLLQSVSSVPPVLQADGPLRGKIFFRKETTGFLVSSPQLHPQNT